MNTATIIILGGLALIIALIVVGQRHLDRTEPRAKQRPGAARQTLAIGAVSGGDAGGGSSCGDGGGGAC